jgi:hypothetical protein
MCFAVIDRNGSGLTVTYTDESNGYSAHQSHSEDWRSEDVDSVSALLHQYRPAPPRL